MTDQELAQVVETTTVFANYHPIKKRGSSSASRTMATRWVTWEMGSAMLQHEGLRRWDLREYRCGYRTKSLNVILLDKDLMVLEKGLVEGS